MQGENKVDIFCTHYQHSHSTRGNLLYHIEHHLGKGFVIFLWVWGFGSWHRWLMPTKCIPLGLLRLRDYSLPHTDFFSIKNRMPVYYKNTFLGNILQKIKISLLNRYLLLCVHSKQHIENALWNGNFLYFVKLQDNI